MISFETKEEAQKQADKLIKERDWEQHTIQVTKAYKPLNGVEGWILLDEWAEPLLW